MDVGKITDSPAELKVIYAKIYRSLDIMNELYVKFIILEVDHAIYTKVIDAMFKMAAEGFEIFKKLSQVWVFASYVHAKDNLRTV